MSFDNTDISILKFLRFESCFVVVKVIRIIMATARGLVKLEVLVRTVKDYIRIQLDTEGNTEVLVLYCTHQSSVSGT